MAKIEESVISWKETGYILNVVDEDGHRVDRHTFNHYPEAVQCMDKLKREYDDTHTIQFVRMHGPFEVYEV